MVNLGTLKRAIDKAFESYDPNTPVYIEIDRVFERCASSCLDSDSLSVSIGSIYLDTEAGTPSINISSTDINEVYIFRPIQNFLEGDQ